MSHAAAKVSGNAEDLLTFEGEVQRLLWGPDPDTGFAVMLLALDDGGSLVVAGPCAGSRAGDRVRAIGSMEDRPPYGTRLKASLVEHDDGSTTDEGLARSLAGLVPGFGEGRALRLVAALGGARNAVCALDALKVLPEVKGVPGPMVASVIEAWRADRADRGVEVALASVGLPPGARTRIRAMYGGDALRVLREEPYRLAREVTGIGFLKADDIALAAGSVLVDSPDRVEAAVVWAIRQAAEEHGDTIVAPSEVATTLCKLFSQRQAPAVFADDPLKSSWGAMDRAVDRGEVGPGKFDGGEVYGLRRLLDSESIIAEGLARARRTPIDVPLDPAVVGNLTSEQVAAVRMVLEQGIAVLAGGPGTGKTTTCRAIVETAKRSGLRIAACAPTARAAKRLRESTGADAMTIHRLLDMKPDYAREYGGAPGYDRGNPLPIDLLLVDETSMVDCVLGAQLLDALPGGCKIVLVGDKDQLPPVGPGAPFRDAIESNAIPVARLTHVHRQAQGSAIVRASHRLLAGLSPEWSNPGERYDGSLHFVQRDKPETAAETLVHVVRSVWEEFGVEPNEALVLSPMRKGPLGCDELNIRLQTILNPQGKPGECSYRRQTQPYGKLSTILREGDRVRQTKNDYNRGVLNGDVGRVLEVRHTDKIDAKTKGAILTVDFGDEREPVPYAREDLKELTLSYCSTVHAAQGGEAQVVVVAVADYHRVMLDRTLLYTALTRAKRACVIVGSAKAIGWAAKNGGEGKYARRTTLKELLKRGMPS